MSFARYPEYKDSGVAWLGEVPGHWAVLQGRRLFSQVREQARPTDDQLSATQKYGVIPQKLFMELEDQKVTLALNGLENFKHVESDDFVISLRSFQGGVERSKYPGCVSPAYTVLRSIAPVIESYWGYLLKSNEYIEALQSMTDGIRDGKTISYQQFGQIPLPVPDLFEQTQIAAFLDRETAKIDALVAQQRRLMELLKEKRQAVISHAVTRGLNPEAPMKPSGLEWLGDVPEHWEVKRLKHISPFITVGIVVNPSTYVSDDGFPFIYGGDIREGVIDWENSRRISSDSSDANAKTRLREGDLLTVRVGAPGITAVVPVECEGGNCASVMLVRKGHFNSHWLCFAMNTRMVRFQVEVVQYGAAQEQFNISHAINFWIATPPQSEQDEIAVFLAAEAAKFDTLTTEAQHAIDLLQERRTALISAAVTGQIDLRQTNHQP